MVSLRLELEDAYNGGSNGQSLNVTTTPVVACVDPAGLASSQRIQGDQSLIVFPNPATDEVMVDFKNMWIKENYSSWICWVISSPVVPFLVSHQRLSTWRPYILVPE